MFHLSLIISCFLYKYESFFFSLSKQIEYFLASLLILLFNHDCWHTQTNSNMVDYLQLLEQFGNMWGPEVPNTRGLVDIKTKGRPWYGLLALLRKYPEHFVINTRSKGKLTLEVVSLVSLLS
jgi:hypothetical protein